MNLNQGKVAIGLVEDILKTVHKYDESLYLPTVLGCLDIVKQQLLQEAMEDDDEYE
jgi:hypothetical protein